MMTRRVVRLVHVTAAANALGCVLCCVCVCVLCRHRCKDLATRKVASHVAACCTLRCRRVTQMTRRTLRWMRCFLTTNKRASCLQLLAVFHPLLCCSSAV